MLIFIFFAGFIAAFYVGGWSMFTGIKRILYRNGSPHGPFLILLAIALFILSCFCFRCWCNKVV